MISTAAKQLKVLPKPLSSPAKWQLTGSIKQRVELNGSDYLKYTHIHIHAAMELNGSDYLKYVVVLVPYTHIHIHAAVELNGSDYLKSSACIKLTAEEDEMPNGQSLVADSAILQQAAYSKIVEGICSMLLTEIGDMPQIHLRCSDMVVVVGSWTLLVSSDIGCPR
ncbi:hypothetical protein FEM48_Zijuj02G0014700 [Ziziphus jujuba var. spinosa]|uniref:Uncharacterized protein n=1 Tax=Ziziphus jujuba var. spinosa TaxID=714518 RepID=A0A978VST9_ZIZJJ|nr:hypothetical protein FEM48_Zijuj02G0014700 [Ziziphus jujuba var. spinosa]